MITRLKFLRPVLLAAILLLAAYLRFANLAIYPAWYTDEGTHLVIARHLLHGQVQYLAINQSWLLFSRLPLFELLLSSVAALSGVSMFTLRFITGSLGVLTVALLYLVVRRSTHDRVLALWAAFLLAIYSPAVLYSRFGFSYNLLAPLLLLTLLGLKEYHTSRSKRWLAVSAFSIGLGTLSELWMFMALVPFTLIVLMRNWRDVVWSVPLALAPFGIYAAIMLLTVPQAFLFDLRFVFLRVTVLTFARQVSVLWQNITTLAGQDVWLVVGSIGLMLLKPKRFRGIVLAMSVIPFLLLGRVTALFSLTFYYLIPLLPFVALGVASLIRYSFAWLTEQEVPRFVIRVLSVALAVVLVSATLQLIEQVRVGFRTDIAGFLLDPSRAQAAAAFINQQAAADDVIIAAPTLAWMWPARTADMQMPIAYRGGMTPHLPVQIPADRWAFNPDFHAARYVIVDNLWRNWAVPNIPGVRAILAEVETWPSVLRSGEVVIYQNPED